MRPLIGDEPPLIADRRRRPDRRQVSARWLAGTLLTGLTSTALMGIALSAAHDGRTHMASPAARVVAAAAAAAPPGQFLEKGERVFATAIPMPRSRRTIEVSTVTVEGEREVIRSQPFAYASMLLAARQAPSADYPAFDPLAVFSQDEEDEPATAPVDAGQIYGGRVEPDVALSMEPFDFADAEKDTVDDIGTFEAEKLVRATAGRLDRQPIQVAAFRSFDPGRFDSISDATSGYVPGSAFRVVQENVSVAQSDGIDATRERYFEEIVPFREERGIAEALAESGYDAADVEQGAAALAGFLKRDTLEAGEVLRVGLKGVGEAETIVRLSAYKGERHLKTAAARSDGTFVEGPEPALSRSVAEAFDENAVEAPLRANMPTVYDGIWQAALAHGLNDRLSQRLIRLLAADVDFQSRLSATDRLTVLYSLEPGRENASAESELLFVEAAFGDTRKRFYRFFSEEDDSVDYYDEEGRSTRQFLLRNPVPTGRFTSNFGERRHPVLGYKRMHWGVDWAAPRGTPILASGGGVVKQAGWSSGYGRQTIIQHANGYETSYSHQNSIAKGVTVGARVRQGQVIGTVGSTGLSTGNHLHYEVSVNGKRVDPLRIRLPEGRALQGDELALFQRERERIDALMDDAGEDVRIAGRQ
ncbi:M23 family metallopeptidase [Aureimonas mangrovi]|uniref:M23 family metallopeptidase n=1 Tax=Aureimonas mangrovi TaxID=2758041 RepID=UPI001FEC5DB4|nr:M23 family metallopeptidase [Aureimonas mangrovi]